MPDLRHLDLAGVGIVATVDAIGRLHRPAAFATLLQAARRAPTLLPTVIVPPLADAETNALGFQRDADGTLGGATRPEALLARHRCPTRCR